MAKPIILVVEGDAALGRLLQRIFEREDFQVEQCAQAAEAKARLSKGGVDLVLADFELSDQNGALLLAEVQDRYPLVKRVLMAASPDAPAVREAVSRGAAEALVLKPWNHAELLGTVRSLLAKT